MSGTRNRKALSSLCRSSKPARNPSIVVWVLKSQTFPPHGWELNLLPGNVCRPDEIAAHIGSRGLLCQDLLSLQGTLIRAGLRFALPARRMSWRLKADIKPTELEMSKGQSIHALAFLQGDDLLAAACLRKIRNDKYAAGVLIRSADGLLRERINVETEGEIFPDGWVRWELDLFRLATRQTTVVLRLDGNEVARINGGHHWCRARCRVRGDFAQARRITDNAARRSTALDGSAAVEVGPLRLGNNGCPKGAASGGSIAELP